MRMLFLGDVVGRSGRDSLNGRLPALRKELDLDFVVVNAENAAAGFGMTPKICDAMFEAGVDVITGGNHSWDQREIIPYISEQKRLQRPANYPQGTPGIGAGLYPARGGKKVAVISVMCRLFMDPLDCPFAAVDRLAPKEGPKSGGADAVLVDVHGEATSEKMA
ncbi:MAG: YmdB family metallophosphoesterase, partial [Alphaproteobacteria bacterium]|nr:YmdB family metallophosphoesterase [Alphaproteobacteria bacterium]